MDSNTDIQIVLIEFGLPGYPITYYNISGSDINESDIVESESAPFNRRIISNSD